MDYNEYIMNLYINEFAPLSGQELFHTIIGSTGIIGTALEYVD